MGSLEEPGHISRSGLCLRSCPNVFRGPLLRRPDARRRHSREPRFMVLGELYGRTLTIIYTPRRGKCRIISLRLASPLEREIYHEYTQG
jgi:uncharacterized DUF497 family protein